MCSQIDVKHLRDWHISEKIEYAYNGQFSVNEKEKIGNGDEVVKDAHYDARHKLFILSQIVDDGKALCVSIQDQEPISHRLLINIIAVDGVVVRKLENGDPIVFIRVSYSTEGEANDVKLNNYLDYLKGFIGPKYVWPSIFCLSGQQCVEVLAKEFEANSKQITASSLSYIEDNGPKHLLSMPNSYTSFFTPMYIPKTPKREIEICRGCSNPGMKVCQRCMVARYCSKDCQVKDWKAGHNKECKTPESKVISDTSLESDQSSLWVDIDHKKKTSPDDEICIRINIPSSKMGAGKFIDPCREVNKEGMKSGETKKTAKMKLYKVELTRSLGSLGSLGSQSMKVVPIDEMLVYSQGEKDMFYCHPENISGGMVTFRKLYDRIEREGICCGPDLSYRKTYFSGYITPEDRLRLFIDKMHPLQPW